ncbi:hypothetical protein BC828DRAFT_374308 [Blastocladiella britannica]|nr:hypothetical protein BC828DRAFT_374308 [Blastocladiella britannica]
MYKLHIRLIVLAAIAAILVHGHGAITGAKGIGGPEGKALGIVDDTPRDGKTRDPFQQDTSIIRDREIASGRTGPCGRTLGGGNNDIAAGVQSLMTDLGGLPMVAAGQPLTMTVHQINADGAGPYRCDLSADGTGTDFVPMQVGQNLKGLLGINPRTSVTDQPLEVTMPAGLKCTGGPNGNMCLVRCRNNTPAGPFGGCVPVQQMAGSAAAPNAGATPDAGAGGEAADSGAGAGAGTVEPPAAGGKKKQVGGDAAAGTGGAAGKKVGGKLGGILGKFGGGAGGKGGKLGAIFGAGKR